MSQFGMQLPGGAVRRGPMMNVYTGLLLCAVAALAVACVVMYMQGSKLGPGGDAFSIQKAGDVQRAGDTP